MEFLDINLTKDSSLQVHAIHSPLNWWILKKTILFSGFIKYFQKKSEKQESSSLFMNSICKNGKPRKKGRKGRKPGTIENQTETQV
jgi:hypothetical protein